MSNPSDSADKAKDVVPDTTPTEAEIAAALAEVKGAPKTRLLADDDGAAGDEGTTDDEVTVSNETVTPAIAVPASTAVEFSPDGGSHRSSVTVSLQCAIPGAQIRYAIDANDVNEGDTLYTEPLLLMQSGMVAARAWVDEQPGPLTTAQFDVLKALWEKREPEDRTDEVPHEISDAADLSDGWKLAAASVRGKLHAHRALWREDAFAHDTVGDWSIVAVSDGAGSAPLSRVGSNLACTAALEYLKTELADWTLSGANDAELKTQDLPKLRSLLVEAGRRALQALRDEAEKRERPLTAFAATLLLVVRAAWNETQVCAALQVGDGAIALWSDEDALTLLGVADHGTHSSETRFLTTSGMEAELPSRVLFSLKLDLRAIAVMTDGVSDDFFPEAQRLGEVFEAVLPQLESSDGAGKTLLEWLGYEKKGSSDDRTLLVVWKP